MGLFNYEKMTEWSNFQEPWYTLIKYAGYNVFDDNFNDKKMALWRLINLSFPSHYILSAVVFCFDENWNVQKSSEAFMIIFVAVIIIVQFLTLLFFQKIFIKLNKFIKHSWKNTQNNEEMTILKERAKEGHVMIVILFISIIITLIAFDLKAAVMKHHKVLPQVFMGYGIRSVEGPYYVLNLIYHNFALCYPIVCLVPFHSFYVSFVMQLVGKIQIIGMHMKRINDNIGKKDKINDILRAHYFSHLEVIRFGQFLSHIFKIFLMSQMGCSSVVLCVTMFTSRANTVSQINSIFVLLACTFHLFIFCWYGEKLRHESDMLGRTIFECPWYALENSQKRVLLIILARTQIPIKIHVLGIYDIGLSTFTMVIKTAYSWCAVLNTVDQ